MGWLELSHWDRRSAEFGAVRMEGLEVVADYLPALREQTRAQWQLLSPHTNVLEPVPGGVKYAAIDWGHGKLALTNFRATTRFASWGIALARVYETIARNIAQQAWLAHPLVKFDLQGVMRIGFLNPELAQLPSESIDQWPLMDERALVHVVVSALVALADEIDWDSHLGSILRRALSKDPASRYRTLAELRAVLADAGGKPLPLVQERTTMWRSLERGLGYLAVDRRDLALEPLRTALYLDSRSTQVQQLVAACAPPAPAPPTVPLAWATARARGAEAERERDFPRAIAIYKLTVCTTDADIVEHALARARCYFELGFADKAVALAREVLARDAASLEARAIETRALLAVKLWPDALRAADAWLGAHPDHGPAHYARGKALLGVNRLVEARDAFDRACLRAPELIAAMWLRVAVDKALSNIRVASGTPVPMPIDLPEGPVRDALLAGRIADAIALLAPSQLQGELLSYVGRHDEALRVFEELDGDAAIAGRARALIDLGRTDEALAILGTLDADADGFVVAVRR